MLKPISVAVLLALTMSVRAQRPGRVAIAPSSIPDFAAAAKAADHVAETIEELTKNLPSIKSANATAHALDRWTEANQAFSTAVETVIAEHPNYPKGAPSYGRRELLAAMAKVKQAQQEKPTLAVGVKELLRRYRDDPEVATSVQSFQASLDRLKKVVNSLHTIMQS